MDIKKLCPHCMCATSGEAVCSHCGKNVREGAEIQHQLKPYTILQGKYLVGDVLGEGGFGITYIGLDINLEIRVAIKEFYPNGFVTRESMTTNKLTAYADKNADNVDKWRESFLSEARSLAKCAHLQGVVGVKDFFQENNTVYIVQEYLEGQTLKAYLKSRGQIPVNELLPMMEPIILALEEVHKQKMIHRDISPDNIMLLKDGSMKVLDFGAARNYGDEDEKSKSVLLKPGYAPEEQYRSRGKQGPWSDVYALCATIYKCITGKTPLESMERLHKDELLMPSALGVPISAAQENALRRGMAIVAENRIQSMAQLHEELYTKREGAVPKRQAVAAKPQPAAVKQPAPADVESGVQNKAASAMTAVSSIPKDKMIPLAICGCVALVAIMLIVGVAKLLGGSRNEKTTAELMTALGGAQSEETAEQTETAVPDEEIPTETAQGLSAEAEAMLANIAALAAEDDSPENLREALEQYYSFCVEVEPVQEAVEPAESVFTEYQDAVIEHVTMLEGQDVAPVIFIQMKMELDEVTELSDRLEQAGIAADSREAQERLAALREDYKERIISKADSLVQQQVEESGIVSRSVLWAALEQADETGLYDEDDIGDPLRRRYAAALALHTESKIEQLDIPYMASRGDTQPFDILFEVMEETDYNPLLVWYLMEWCELYNSYGYRVTKGLDMDDIGNGICQVFDLYYVDSGMELRNYAYEYGFHDYPRCYPYSEYGMDYASAREVLAEYVDMIRYAVKG